jgi:hypothetical protein
MDTRKELKAIRYLLNDIILSLHDMRVTVNELLPAKKQRKIVDVNADGNSVCLDLFSIKKTTYEDLINTFGLDVVNLACTKLDEFIKINCYVPYGNASHALRRKFIKEVLYERDNKCT